MYIYVHTYVQIVNDWFDIKSWYQEVLLYMHLLTSTYVVTYVTVVIENPS